jgi:1-acyl-sn-glycerol-3-phosphate acyltransferase
MRHALTIVRSALYLVLLVVTVVPWAFVVCGAFVTPVHTRYWLATRWTTFAIWAAKAVCGIRYRVEGWENLPDAPAVVLPKHQSAWETLWLPSFLPRELTFVYKRELHLVPFFGWGLGSLQMISIDRSKGGDAFEQVVEQGTDRLQRGWWIVIFPEGTRTPPGSNRRYKTGGARLAVRTGAMAIPIAHNSGELWPRKAFVKLPGEVTVSIGPPIDPAGKTADEVAARVEEWIETEMRRLAPHRYAEPYDARRREENRFATPKGGEAPIA